MTNDKGVILADSIAHLPHAIAWDLLVKKRFTDLELDKILVYLIDSVDASLLPLLAEQFDVLGYKGLRLATNEQEERQIIKRAIELKRFRGTLWAVKESLKAVGYGDCQIIEHVEGNPFKFRVIVDIGTHPVNVVEIADVVKMINEYKNARSHLEDISYTLNFADDEILISEDLNVSQASYDEDTLVAGGDFIHNGQNLRNGSRNYSQDSDTITIEII